MGKVDNPRYTKENSKPLAVRLEDDAYTEFQRLLRGQPMAPRVRVLIYDEIARLQAAEKEAGR